MNPQPHDTISPEQAGTLYGLFRERARRSPEAVAYRDFDADAGAWRDTTWSAMSRAVSRWRAALAREGLQAGDRVAIMLRNCREWVMYDQAALASGLVTVPLYTQDRADNSAYCLDHSDAKLLLIEGEEHWRVLAPVLDRAPKLGRILCLRPVGDEDPRLILIDDWLAAAGKPSSAAGAAVEATLEPDDLATIVYTSGTTGRPKGVMLSHRNILSDIHMGLQAIPLTHVDEEVFLSFLPLSHTLERSAGYYLPMMAGATVAFARSIPELAEDLVSQRPTALISVPRIYERVYARLQEQLAHKPKLARGLFKLAVSLGWRHFEHAQGRAPWHPSLLAWPLLDRLVATKLRARLGGRLRYAISGGAPLNYDVTRVFVALGVPLLQGYGLTETSPIVSVCRPSRNRLGSIGPPLPGQQVRIGPDDELLIKGDNVMLGYWKDPQATREAIDAEGWLHSGDKARMEDGCLYIVGRLKEIIVLANGEKVPPADMEMAMETDPLIEQSMVIGEGRPFLVALVVLARDGWEALAAELGLDPEPDPGDPGNVSDPRLEAAVLERIATRTAQFPGYAKVVRAHVSTTPWKVADGLLTPTLKIRRGRIYAAFRDRIEGLYAGH